jgi:hypothetical protein
LQNLPALPGGGQNARIFHEFAVGAPAIPGVLQEPHAARFSLWRLTIDK